VTETITSTETERRRYVGAVPGVVGPSIVEVVTYAHESDVRPVLRDSYAVEVNGQHRYGFGPGSTPDNHPANVWRLEAVAEDPGPVRQVRYGRPDQYVPVRARGGWAVRDLVREELSAGPYATEVQAVYVAAVLSADPTRCPYAPDHPSHLAY
jgi:hypothetical protein